MIAAKLESVLSHSDLDKGTEKGGVCGRESKQGLIKISPARGETGLF